jgi:hypothetical protein
MEAARRIWESNKSIISFAAAIMSVAIGVLYLFVLPEGAHTAAQPMRFALQYGHSLCWFLLATTFALIPVAGTATIRKITGYSALVCYAAFMASFILTR